MADQFAIVTETTPSSPGTLDLTSGSITETVKAAVFIYGASTTADSIIDHARHGIALWANDGAVNSPGTESLASHFFRALNGETTTDARGQSFLNSISSLERDSTPAVDMTANTVTAISGGVRLNFTLTTSTTSITALIFAGIARAWHSTVAATTALQHENTGGAGNMFQPDLLIVSGSEGGFGSAKNDHKVDLGFVVGSAHAGASIDIDRGTNPTDSDGRVDGVELPYMLAGSGGSYHGVTFTIDSTGYDYQRTSGTGVTSPDLAVLAIQFTDDMQMATDNLAVGTGSMQSFSVGFQPMLVFGMSTLIASENTTTDGPTASTAGLFMFTTGSARAMSGSHQEGVTISMAAPSVSKFLQGNYAVATLSHTGSAAQLATLDSFTATGFTLNFTSATAGHLTLLAIGPADALFVVDDTETISDSCLLIQGLFRTVSDTVGITDSCVFVQAAAVTMEGPIGTTLVASSKRGTTILPGAAAGTTL